MTELKVLKRERAVNQQLVEMLMSALEEAKSGALHGGIFVGVSDKVDANSISFISVHGHANQPMLIGMLDVMKTRLILSEMSDMDRENEE